MNKAFKLLFTLHYSATALITDTATAPQVKSDWTLLQYRNAMVGAETAIQAQQVTARLVHPSMNNNYVWMDSWLILSIFDLEFYVDDVDTDSTNSLFSVFCKSPCHTSAA